MQKLVECILKNMKQVIVGDEEILENVMISLLSGGHILLEGFPGIGKTKLALAIARSVEGEFKRIQFTPDVLPSDITGFSLFNRNTKEFEYQEGAAMCHFLLGDEINRASPRVQSSLLEAMEERQITVDGRARKLPNPFMVIATQNTIENQGTYPLPEAQMDRFFMKLSMNYPNRAQWRQIMDRFEKDDPLDQLKGIVTIEEVLALQRQVTEVMVSSEIKEYILDIIVALMNHEGVQIGVSPRGSIALLKAIKAMAFIKGRDYVIPDDVQKVAEPVLGHRLILAPNSEWNNIKSHDILQDVLRQIMPPVFR